MSDETTAASGKAPVRPETPELDRQKEARDEGHSEAIGAFMEWLGEQCYHICTSDGDNFYPTGWSINTLLAAYFKIDLNKVEQERRALLEYVRELQP